VTKVKLASFKGKVSEFQGARVKLVRVCRRRFNAEQVAAILHRVLEPES